MQELKQKWEEWYGDVVDDYHWYEIDFNGNMLLYVCGSACYTGDEKSFPIGFIQVIGYPETNALIDAVDQEGIIALLKSTHGIDNISFWSI